VKPAFFVCLFYSPEDPEFTLFEILFKEFFLYLRYREERTASDEKATDCDNHC